MAQTFSLKKVVQLLAAYYGQPAPPTHTEPWEMILAENVAYLVDDKQRETAFAGLRREVGIRPHEILSAPLEKLLSVAKLGGMRPEARVVRLREIALIALEEFEGNLKQVLKQPPKQAKKALKRFPGIADPGAEKILLFGKAYPFLALESNGLRALLRVGFGEEGKNYSASYRSVQAAFQDQIGVDCEFLIRAYQLLRQHGKNLCRTSYPACEVCPLNTGCEYYLRERRAKG